MHTAATLERAANRFKAFKRAVKSVSPAALAGEALDLGCGRGEFVLTALEAGVRARGLDVNVGGIETFRRSAPESWRDNCQVYDGNSFPFEAGTFSAIHSWFVFEHLERPHETVSELSRVAAKGCVLSVNAQDGRTLLEGHEKIPWLPFMPRPLRSAWLDELTTPDRRDYVLDAVFPTTADEVAATLRFFDWHICSLELVGPRQVPDLAYPRDESSARSAAREALQLHRSGNWPQAPLNYRIIAVHGARPSGLLAKLLGSRRGRRTPTAVSAHAKS